MLHIMQFSELLLQNFNYYEVSCMCRSVTMEGGHHQTVLMWLVEASIKAYRDSLSPSYSAEWEH